MSTNNDISIWKDAIKDRISKAGLTQVQVAEILSTTQGNINGILNNESRFFQADQLATLADYFHISIDELLGRNISGYQFDTLADIMSYFIALDDALGWTAYVDVSNPDTVRINLSLDSGRWALGGALEQFYKIKHVYELPADVRQVTLEAWTKKAMQELQERKRKYGYRTKADIDMLKMQTMYDMSEW